jgi:hypothetical protein
MPVTCGDVLLELRRPRRVGARDSLVPGIDGPSDVSFEAVGTA